MEKIFTKAHEERIGELKDRVNKLVELTDIKKTGEISEEEYDDLLGAEIQSIQEEFGELILKSSGKAWNFSEEKRIPLFTGDDILALKPLNEECIDLYAKTRDAHALIKGFYSNPENLNMVLEEIKNEEALFMKILRKEDDAYLGYVGLKDTSKNLWEFCVELLPEYCNQGYGYNAVKLFLKKVSEITGDDKQQFMALVEVDNIPSQKLMLKLGGRLIDIYDILFHDEERAEKFEEEHLDEITGNMRELAAELMIEPRKLLSHVLDYRIFAEKL